MKIISKKKKSSATGTVRSFWMSNEITNSEYREFVNYVRSNPNGFLSIAEPKVIIVGDSASGNKRDSLIFKKNFVKFSAMMNDLIDTVILGKENIIYKNYFTDEKFNDYPVVGVSCRNATYYCAWRTKMDNDRLKLEGKPSAPEYRLPTEEEWAYVASLPIMGSKIEVVVKDPIKPSKYGDINLYGLYNISGNVSEWTSTFPTEEFTATKTERISVNGRIVRGGSWKTSPNINASEEIAQDTRTSYIGFRVVRSEDNK